MPYPAVRQTPGTYALKTKPDDREADQARGNLESESERFGPKPDNATQARWAALQ